MDKVRVMRHGRVVQVPNQAPMVLEVGVQGIPGRRGEKGESFEYEDLTAEQKQELKGDKGDKGDPGQDAHILPIDVAVIDNLF